MERVARIELASSAWKAEVLPLNHTRKFAHPCLRQSNPNQLATSGGGGRIRTYEG